MVVLDNCTSAHVYKHQRSMMPFRQKRWIKYDPRKHLSQQNYIKVTVSVLLSLYKGCNENVQHASYPYHPFEWYPIVSTQGMLSQNDVHQCRVKSVYEEIKTLFSAFERSRDF
jgi:hypothetical protein